MTTAATPKGLRRRALLIAAAGELLREGGYDAVRHRAVAERAELPLASTTYYFESLEDLVVEAVTYACETDLAAVRERLETVSTRLRNAPEAAALLSGVFVGTDPDRRVLTARVESLVLAARSPRLVTVAIEHHRQLCALHIDALARCGRAIAGTSTSSFVSIEHGCVAVALATHEADLRAYVARTLAEVVDSLAPATDRARAAGSDASLSSHNGSRV